MNILIVRLSSLGDIAHAMPVVPAIRRAYPGGRIDWLVDSRFSKAVTLLSPVDTILPVDLSGKGIRSFLPSTVRTLRETHYDLCIDLQGLVKSALLARLSGAKRVVGFSSPHLRERPAAIFYTEQHDPGPFGHVIEKNFGLLRAAGIHADIAPIPVETSGREDFVLIQPGASWKSKQWPVDRFAGLAQQISGAGVQAKISCGPLEEGAVFELRKKAGSAVEVIYPAPMGELIRLMSRARLFIGCDSGPLHIAAALGTPCVGLFGPTDPARNGPWQQERWTVSRFSVCSCRYKRNCTAQQRCIESIATDEVFAKVQERLQRAEGPE